QINRALVTMFFLRADSPTEETFLGLMGQSSNPAELLKRCWDTGRIPHRQLVASYLKASAGDNPAWFAQAEPLVIAGTLDPDMSVRELAFAALESRHDPRLFDLAQAQLKDLDPMIRQLGLQYLQRASAERGVPALMPLLDDPDLQIVTRAEAALMRWTGQDFGVRVRLAIHRDGALADGSSAQADEQKIKAGVTRRKQWWAQHATEFATHESTLPSIPRSVPEVVRDFSLPTPSGDRVRLASFRGRVIVLNFWATWCTACLEEIPDLAALHGKLGDKIGVIGVALDGLPAASYHNPVREAEEHSVGKSLQQIQQKVRRAIAAQGINYTVLLDPTGAVGGRFNGGELPTTVIIDGAGRVRRRFIGERSLGVFEAMIAEAAQPLQ